MRYSKGICWIGDCRIPFVDEKDPSTKRYESYRNVDKLYGGYGDTHNQYKEQQGRFTPNLLVCDDMLNDGKKYGNLFQQKRNKDVDGGTGNSLVRAHKQGESNGVFDNGTSSSRFYDLDKWFDKVIEQL
jgi:hypothetical protein